MKEKVAAWARRAWENTPWATEARLVKLLAEVRESSDDARCLLEDAGDALDKAMIWREARTDLQKDLVALLEGVERRHALIEHVFDYHRRQSCGSCRNHLEQIANALEEQHALLTARTLRGDYDPLPEKGKGDGEAG